MLTVEIEDRTLQSKGFVEYIKTLPFIKSIRNSHELVEEVEDDALLQIMGKIDRTKKASYEEIMEKLQ